jgi:hypothetical protein
MYVLLKYIFPFWNVKITGRPSRLQNDRLQRMEWTANIIIWTDEAMKVIWAQSLVYFSGSITRPYFLHVALLRKRRKIYLPISSLCAQKSTLYFVCSGISDRWQWKHLVGKFNLVSRAEVCHYLCNSLNKSSHYAQARVR